MHFNDRDEIIALTPLWKGERPITVCYTGMPEPVNPPVSRESLTNIMRGDCVLLNATSISSRI